MYSLLEDSDDSFCLTAADINAATTERFAHQTPTNVSSTTNLRILQPLKAITRHGMKLY